MWTHFKSGSHEHTWLGWLCYHPCVFKSNTSPLCITSTTCKPSDGSRISLLLREGRKGQPTHLSLRCSILPAWIISLVLLCLCPPITSVSRNLRSQPRNPALVAKVASNSFLRVNACRRLSYFGSYQKFSPVFFFVVLKACAFCTLWSCHLMIADAEEGCF